MSARPRIAAEPRRQILFNPGPVNLDQRVKDATFAVELCHRQPEFEQLHGRIKANLFNAVALSPARHRLSLLHGSGTLAVDAALTSVVRGRVLVVDNGVYCRRLAATLGGVRGAEVDHFAVGDGSAVDLNALGARMEQARPDWIATVHHETMTGLLNPMAAIADLAGNFSCRLFVDCVSSLGVHAPDPRADVLCFSSSKCLESLPGIAGVFWSAELESQASVPVLDIAAYAEGMPSTPNVQAVLALDAALEIHAQEDRPARYERLARHVWSVGSQSFSPLLPEAERSHVLTAFRLGGEDYRTLMTRAQERGYVIYAGQGPLYDRIFRVANMGAAIDEGLIEDLFEAISR